MVWLAQGQSIGKGGRGLWIDVLGGDVETDVRLADRPLCRPEKQVLFQVRELHKQVTKSVWFPPLNDEGGCKVVFLERNVAKLNLALPLPQRPVVT